MSVAAITSAGTLAVIGRLQEWSEDNDDFAGDRALSDAVLMECGWSRIHDDAFEGGEAWTLGTLSGVPRITVAAAHRPHLILSVEAALGQRPIGTSVRLMIEPNESLCWLDYPRGAGGMGFGRAPYPAVAVCIAVLRLKLARAG